MRNHRQGFYCLIRTCDRNVEDLTRDIIGLAFDCNALEIFSKCLWFEFDFPSGGSSAGLKLIKSLVWSI